MATKFSREAINISHPGLYKDHHLTRAWRKHVKINSSRILPSSCQSCQTHHQHHFSSGLNKPQVKLDLAKTNTNPCSTSLQSSQRYLHNGNTTSAGSWISTPKRGNKCFGGNTYVKWKIRPTHQDKGQKHPGSGRVSSTKTPTLTLHRRSLTAIDEKFL